MKSPSWIILGVLTATTIASSASAELVGLCVFREEPGGPGTPPPGPERWIYRVYAEFTNPTDKVLAWGTGFSSVGFGGIWNITEDGMPGSGFTNIPDSSFSNTAPLFAGTFADWDTYMTVGVLYGIEGPGNFDYAQDFNNSPIFISNGATAWTGPNGAILVGNNEQGSADYRISGNDTAHRVLLMQLVVNAGEHVHGAVGVGWGPPEGPFMTTPNITFTSIPAPAGFIVLAISAIQPRRRRI